MDIDFESYVSHRLFKLEIVKLVFLLINGIQKLDVRALAVS